MERQPEALQRRLTELLREAAEVSVALDRADGTIEGVPHYTVIERRAHELGRQLSRSIQQRHLHEMAGHQVTQVTCPGCGKLCESRVAERSVTSIDGPLDLSEPRADCPRCRRAFFPLASGSGLRRP